MFNPRIALGFLLRVVLKVFSSPIVFTKLEFESNCVLQYDIAECV